MPSERDQRIAERGRYNDARELKDMGPGSGVYAITDDEGDTILRIEGSNSDGFGVYLPNGDRFSEEADFEPPFARRKAVAYCYLIFEYEHRYDETLIHYQTENATGEIVPTKVSTMGKPAVAVYLLTVQKLSRGEIARILDVSPNTIRQYVYDFISLNRTVTFYE